MKCTNYQISIIFIELKQNSFLVPKKKYNSFHTLNLVTNIQQFNPISTKINQIDVIMLKNENYLCHYILTSQGHNTWYLEWCLQTPYPLHSTIKQIDNNNINLIGAQYNLMQAYQSNYLIQFPNVQKKKTSKGEIKPNNLTSMPALNYIAPQLD